MPTFRVFTAIYARSEKCTGAERDMKEQRAFKPCRSRLSPAMANNKCAKHRIIKSRLFVMTILNRNYYKIDNINTEYSQRCNFTKFIWA